MHLALYRQFRPRTFDGVIGQDHITTTLSNQVASGNISHAYLFTGSRGTGKTTCARIFARAINCLNNKNGSPCGECEACVALNEANSTDIIEMDAASNNKVDEIRDLREKVKFPPMIARKKVYIIDEVHMLTDSAFNALLKTLEEPPEHAVFILATTEVHKLPATILSRCMRFDFKLVPTQNIAALLKKLLSENNIRFDDQSINAIASSGEGSVRDALSIADAVSSYCNNDISYEKALFVIGKSKITSVYQIVESLINDDIKQFFLNMNEVLSQSKNISVLCKELAGYFKTLILIKNGITDRDILSIMPDDFDMLKVQSEKCSMEKLVNFFEKISAVELDLKYSITPQTLLESTCISCLNLGRQKIDAEDKKETDLTAGKKMAEQSSGNVKKTIEIETENIIFAEDENESAELQEIGPDDEIFTQAQQSSAGSSDSLSAERVWGEILIAIKEKNMFALSTALKTTFGVQNKNGRFSVKTNEKHSLEIINENNRHAIILNMLKNLDKSINTFEVILDENTKNADDIIIELKELFGNKLRIED